MRRTPHPFSLRQLQYVLAVADERSFRAAASSCRVSQPSLSAQIAGLEEALGVRLFERGPKQVLVTPAGRELLERMRRLVVDADELVEASKRVGDPLSGTIRAGVIPTLAPYVLPLIAPALRAAFPRLTLAWREEKTDRLVAGIGAGVLDAALVAVEAEIGDLDREIVAADPFVLALPPSHPLARRSTPVEAAELRGADVLLLDEGHCFRRQALEVCATSRAREGEFRATSLTTLVQMVAGGAGITLLPSIAVATEAARAGLVVRPLASPRAGRTIAWVWRRRSPMASELRAIAEVLRASFPTSTPASTTAPTREPRKSRCSPRG